VECQCVRFSVEKILNGILIVALRILNRRSVYHVDNAPDHFFFVDLVANDPDLCPFLAGPHLDNSLLVDPDIFRMHPEAPVE
jgi:hypothetical protein